jgi:hypothetical protein
MKRREAIALFEEICGYIPGTLINGASLTITNRAEGFELRVNAELNNENRENIQSIAKKRNMTVEESKRSFVIFEPKLEQDAIEIIA